MLDALAAAYARGVYDAQPEGAMLRLIGADDTAFVGPPLSAAPIHKFQVAR